MPTFFFKKEKGPTTIGLEQVTRPAGSLVEPAVSDLHSCLMMLSFLVVFREEIVG